MKKVVAVLGLCLLALFTHDVSGQVKYNKGDVFLNLGIGAGYYYAGGVPFIASAEYAINDLISVGPYLGFTSFNDRAFGFRRNYNFFDIGGRGSYHFGNHLNLNTDKLDLYGGVILGFVVSTYSDNNFGAYNNPYENTFRAGIVGGARWYFTPSFSANGEVGAGGITPLLLGVSFKF